MLKKPEQPPVPRGIVLRGMKVLKHVLKIGQASAKPVKPPTLAQLEDAVMRILQIGAVAERGGWKAKTRQLDSPHVSSKWDAKRMMIEYGKTKDRRDKKHAQGLGGYTYLKKGSKPNRTGNK